MKCTSATEKMLETDSGEYTNVSAQAHNRAQEATNAKRLKGSETVANSPRCSVAVQEDSWHKLEGIRELRQSLLYIPEERKRVR